MSSDKPSAPDGYCQCGCGEPTNPGRQFRRGHWARVRPPIDLADTFWGRVDQRGADDCWRWGAFCRPGGYGMVWDPIRKRMVHAHIAAYELTHGVSLEQPGRRGSDGIIVRHTCDNPPCCNPAHLIVGSHLDNMADRGARGRHANVRGEKNPNTKLTRTQIAVIRADYTGKYGEKMAIARRYGVSSGHVSKIIAGDVW